LRAVQTADAALVTRWKNDPLVRKMALGPDTKARLRDQHKDISEAIGSPRQSYWMVVIRETRQPIGYVRVNWIDADHRCAWLRFALGEQRGHGFAKDALRALLGHMFHQGVHRIEAEVYQFNRASLRLLEALGFRREGIKREAHFDGRKYANILVLGLLAKDWKARLRQAVRT
jgi:ribosomal-protein-alanine N-acetyltransferase